MRYTWKWLEEAAWFAVVFGGMSVAQVLANTDNLDNPEAWGLALLAAALRGVGAGLLNVLVKLAKP